MSNQPRDENGQFIELKVVESEEGRIKFRISEFECRVIGHRLNRAKERYKKLHNDVNSSIEQDLAYWSGRFLNKVSSRDRDGEFYNKGKKRHTNSNYNVEVRLTDYECWSLGNRLFEIGDWFEEKGYEYIGAETKWLARRFHAEQKKFKNEDAG